MRISELKEKITFFFFLNFKIESENIMRFDFFATHFQIIEILNFIGINIWVLVKKIETKSFLKSVEEI